MEYSHKREKHSVSSRRDPLENSIRQAIDVIFTKYDLDHNGTLDMSEVRTVINDAFRNYGSNRSITDEDVKRFVQAVDVNSDGAISKDELFQVFKKAIITELSGDKSAT